MTTNGSVTIVFYEYVPTSPGITSAASTSFGVGDPGTFTVTATGYPTPALTYDGSLPVGVNFGDNGDGTATLSRNPVRGHGGTYVLTIHASNGSSPTHRRPSCSALTRPRQSPVPRPPPSQ